MGYALVGTIGAASQGASGAAVTPAWGTSENRTAGNLLVCFVAVTHVATLPTTPAGWSIAKQTSISTTASATIFYKIAAGADAAPTIAAITSGIIAAQLAEFSGNSATPLDQTGSATGSNTTPVTATLAAADFAAGELLLMCCGDRNGISSANLTWTSNNATVTQAGNNNGTNTGDHYSFGYSLSTTSNSSADTAVLTISALNADTVAVVAATFLFASVSQKIYSANQAVKRGSFF